MRARNAGITLRSSVEHQLGVRAHFLERMREHPQQQRFECLAGTEQADVRRRRRRQQSAQRVERLGANHRPIHAVGIVRRLRILRAEMRFHRRNPARVGLEREVHRARELRGERRAARLRRARDTSSGRSVGRCTARSAWTARDTPSGGPTRAPWSGCSRRLRTRCARCRAARPNRRRTRSARARTAGRRGRCPSAASRSRRRRHVAAELVEEQPAQRLRRSRIAREQRALDRLGQIGQREDRSIGVGEVRRERLRLRRS